MSTYVWGSILRPKNFLIIIGKSKSSLHGLTSSDFCPTTDTWQWLLSFQYFKCTFCVLGIFFENRKNSGLTPGQNDDPDVKDDPVTQWPTSISGDQTHRLGQPQRRAPAACYATCYTLLVVYALTRWYVGPNGRAVARGCWPHRAALARGGKRAKIVFKNSRENSDCNFICVCVQ